jgi:hypothetical protein
VHDGRTLVEELSKKLNLSAAAIMLLRTLDRDHTVKSRVGEHLFPCCGHAMYVVADSDDVEFMECPNGLDFLVSHGIGRIALRFESGDEVKISFVEWRSAVLAFSDAVAAFYASSAPKKPKADELVQTGFKAFQAEWKRRSDAARV